MKKVVLLTLLSSLFLLGGCTNTPTTSTTANGNNNAGGNGGQVTPTVSAKEKVINYVKSAGTYSDGSYLLYESSKESDDTTVYTTSYMFSYTPNDDQFSIFFDFEGKKIATSATVDLMGIGTFSWNAYTSGQFGLEVKAGSKKIFYVLSDTVFGSSATISSCSFTITSNTLGMTTSDAKSYANTCLKGYNAAATWAYRVLSPYGTIA